MISCHGDSWVNNENTGHDTLPKSPTGIEGLDDVLRGGLPRGRTTLVYGGPGCGKTVLAMEFIVRGVADYDEPGAFISFEENVDDLLANFASFGFELSAMAAAGKLAVGHVPISRADVIEAGEFSLDALFIRIEQTLNRVGAKRLALDSLASLFSHISNAARLRAELSRLFAWLKEKAVTSIVTGEASGTGLSRDRLHEYVSDCVLALDHRVSDQVSKRRLRIIKYRGSDHGLDEYPFLIGAAGISIAPVSSMDLELDVSEDRVSSGVPDLDTLLDKHGYYRGSSIMISGSAGTGKTTLAAAFAAAACARNERCLYLAFEEPPAQLVRNLRSVAIDLATWRQRDLLHFRAFRPTHYGLEEHLASMLRAADKLRPDVVVMDPITNFISVGAQQDVKSMLSRVLHGFKRRGITALFTSLTPTSAADGPTNTAMSSLMDAWLAISHRFDNASHHLEIRIIKARGMAHSHDTHQLQMSAKGLRIVSAGASP